MSEETIHCYKCKSDQVWNLAITRRPNTSEETSKICDQCATHEAFLDISDNIVESGLLHREYSFFQLCCGGKGKSGHERFLEFLKFRKDQGKNDPSPKEIDSIIWQKMFN
tara:strand:+ start:66 stop:395 length:330 start_codon:yes stop_codon:yes gene_type:complete